MRFLFLLLGTVLFCAVVAGTVDYAEARVNQEQKIGECVFTDEAVAAEGNTLALYYVPQTQKTYLAGNLVMLDRGVLLDSRLEVLAAHGTYEVYADLIKTLDLKPTPVRVELDLDFPDDGVSEVVVFLERRFIEFRDSQRLTIKCTVSAELPRPSP